MKTWTLEPKQEFELAKAIELLRLQVREGRALMAQIEASAEEVYVLLRTASDNATGAGNGGAHRQRPDRDDGLCNVIDVGRMVRDGGTRSVK